MHNCCYFAVAVGQIDTSDWAEQSPRAGSKPIDQRVPARDTCTYLEHICRGRFLNDEF